MKKPVPRESEIQSAILDYLHAKRIFCWKEHSGGIPIRDGKYFMPIGLKGKADILGCYQGRFLAIEVKRPGTGMLSEEQSYFLRRITEEGGLAFVATSVEDVIKHGLL